MYVKDELRPALDFINPLPVNGEELAFAIMNLIHRYLLEVRKEVSFAGIGDVYAALETVTSEFRRTVAAPYLMAKASKNGSVSSLDVPQEGDTSPNPSAPVDVSSLAAALVQALGKPLPGPIAAPKRRNKAARLPSASPSPEGSKAGPLGKGESRVLTGPIPGDTPGRDVVLKKSTGPFPPKGASIPRPGKDASPAEKAMYELAEGSQDEF